MAAEVYDRLTILFHESVTGGSSVSTVPGEASVVLPQAVVPEPRSFPAPRPFKEELAEQSKTSADDANQPGALLAWEAGWPVPGPVAWLPCDNQFLLELSTLSLC
jgi:hypothetical protein